MVAVKEWVTGLPVDVLDETSGDARYLGLDQTTPQSILNGQPNFTEGISLISPYYVTETVAKSPLTFCLPASDVFGGYTPGDVVTYHVYGRALAGDGTPVYSDGYDEYVNNITAENNAIYFGNNSGTIIFRDVNGGGFNTYFTPAGSHTDNNGSNFTWSAGSTTTPTSPYTCIANPPRGVFDVLSGLSDIYLDVSGNLISASGMTASSFTKVGGTSSQFLKADGSVDSSTYLSSLTGALLLDQTSAQTFTGGGVTGTGLLKTTSGLLGLDTTAYAPLASPTFSGAVAVGTSLAGATMVVNGTWESSVAPALTTGNWTLQSYFQYLTSPNRIEKHADGTGSIQPTISLAPTIGKTYRITMVVDSFSGTGSISYNIGSASGISIAATGTYVSYHTATSTNNLFIAGSNTTRFVLSSITVEPLAAGTGTLSVDGALTVNSSSSFRGNLTFGIDSVYDIGVTGARPRNIVIGGGITASSGSVVANILQSGNYYFSTRSKLTAPTDGNLLLTNAAANSAGLFQMGGTTSSFPALKRSSAGFISRFADDSADTTMQASTFISTAAVRLKGYTVATLPATPTQGDTAFVTDAVSPTFLGALTGGGAVVTPVFYNGAAWVAY